MFAIIIIIIITIIIIIIIIVYPNGLSVRALERRLLKSEFALTDHRNAVGASKLPNEPRGFSSYHVINIRVFLITIPAKWICV